MKPPDTEQIGGTSTRKCAQDLLHAVIYDQQPLDKLLQNNNSFQKFNQREKAFIRNLVATTLRRLGQIDAIIDNLLNRPLPRSARPAYTAMRLGICQILFLETHNHAAVNTSVDLAKLSSPAKFIGLVNAILRKITLCNKKKLIEKFDVKTNLPDWLFDSWVKSFGSLKTMEICNIHALTPPLDLTINKNPEDWAAILGGQRIGKSTVRLHNSGKISKIHGYDEGAWWVQDAAAALPAQLIMNTVNSGFVCDLCAAPGGKTAQLAAAGYQVTAVDISSARINMLLQNMSRLKLVVDVVEENALAWKPKKLYRAILVDAPCSATGTARRHPEILHQKNSKDLRHKNALQKSLINQAANLVEPGGVIVYSVCSLERSEGYEQIVSFLKSNTNFEVLPVEKSEVKDFEACVTIEGFVQTTPAHLAEQGGVDGFFAGRLKKRLWTD